MRFLIKAAFWFGLVLLVLPFFSGEKQPGTAEGPALKVDDAVTAAGGLVDYMKGLCGEKPEVCIKGGEALAALGSQAREGAYIAYRMLDRQFGSGSESAAPPALSPPSAVSGLAELGRPAATARGAASLESEAEQGYSALVGTPAALNQPMPYRPPVEDAAELADPAAPVSTGAIPLPRPRPKG